MRRYTTRQIMGRSSKSSQYVKMGSPADEPSWVEIELKGRKGKKNLVIRRVLARDKDSSQFLMDGELRRVTDCTSVFLRLGVCVRCPRDECGRYGQDGGAECPGQQSLVRWKIADNYAVHVE